MPWWLVVLIVLGVVIVGVTIYDLTQREVAILRTYPVIGHFRYLLESVGPELRQYIVTDNDEERPFSRDRRHWVYATAADENPYFGFGTDNNHLEQPGYLLIRHHPFPLPAPEEHANNGYAIAAPKVIGERRERARAFRPASIINISAMSFGSLSGPAIEALNRGAELADCLHNTGEGGVSDHHRHGGDLVYQFGTGYFGCRDEAGRFSLERFRETVASAPVRGVEVKLSQGAKPGLGGVLPGKKVTAEISAARGVPIGETVISPSAHTAFSSIESMVEFVELLAEESGLPIGIKSAVGKAEFWDELAAHMADTGLGPDFITVDGGEGGTGAGPLVFTDHVALPFRQAMATVYRAFVARDLQRDITFIGGGKLGFPADALAALSLGADVINVGREAMLAIGCIQAQKCHTDHCPTGVATQSAWRVRGLDPTLKSVRLANYLRAFRHDLDRLARACGERHPALVPRESLDLVDQPEHLIKFTDQFGYDSEWPRFHEHDLAFMRGLS